jgi:hypothetical protein
MTPMDRWISQDVGEEAWNNVHGVYGDYEPPADDIGEGNVCSKSEDGCGMFRSRTGSANWSVDGVADGEGREKG